MNCLTSITRNIQIVVCCFIAATCISCSEEKLEQSDDLLRELPPDLSRFLSSGDDSSLMKYGRDAGIVTLKSSTSKLVLSYQNLSPDRYDRDAPILMGYLDKLAHVIDSEYRYSYFSSDLKYLQSLPRADLDEVLSLRRRELKLYWDPGIAHTDKIEQIEEIRGRLMGYGDGAHVFIIKLHISNLYARMGREEESIRFLHEAIRGFEQYGMHIMTSQALGTLGSHFRKIGAVDSMIACYEKARALSIACRHPSQIARISSFYAGHYIQEGRLGLGHELLYEAMELCREYGGGSLELRYICEAMSFYADLECWDLVGKLLDRARILERLYAEESNLIFFTMDLLMRRVHITEARFMMARGDIDGSEAVFESVETTPVEQYHHLDMAGMYFYWAKGLVDNGRLDRADAVCKKGIEYTRRFLLKDWEAKLTLLEARMEYSRGDMRASELALRRFPELAEDFEDSLYQEYILYDSILARVRLAAGDSAEAFVHLKEGIEKLDRYVTSRDASAHSYLLIEKFDDLCDLFHNLVAYSPDLCYGVELYWQQLYRDLGTTAHGSMQVSPKDIVTGDESAITLSQRDGHVLDSVMALSERVRARVTKQDAMHCSYMIHRDEIWRLVASSERIRCEILDVTVDDLRKIVSRTLSMMKTPPMDLDQTIPSELVDQLRILAGILLPAEVLQSSDSAEVKLLYITANGFLGRIPFEAFDVSKGTEYVPLLLRRNVVYLRYSDAAQQFMGDRRGLSGAASEPTGDRRGVSGAVPQPTGDRHGLVVLNTEPSTVYHRKRIFTGNLTEILDEGRVMTAADPEAIVLVGKEATKMNLLDAWENATYIYFATHVIHDSSVPYLVHIPLAEPSGRMEVSMHYLDMTDIRAADLGRCQLVVLSGCCSGVPYCEKTIAGPALGDVFLDSGAGSVIHTFWEVHDESANELMSAFARCWLGEGMPPVDALCRMRREALKGDNGIKHPFTWASYSIKVGRI